MRLSDVFAREHFHRRQYNPEKGWRIFLVHTALSEKNIRQNLDPEKVCDAVSKLWLGARLVAIMVELDC